MTREEKIQLRMNILGGMNEHVLLNCDTDDELTYWYEAGIPDGATEEILQDIAEDNELWSDICTTFANLNRY